MERLIMSTTGDFPSPGEVLPCADEMSRLGDRLRELRHEAELSQQALARRAHVSQKTISQIEGGKRQQPIGQTISKLDKALGTRELSRILEDQRGRTNGDQSALSELQQVRDEIREAVGRLMQAISTLRDEEFASILAALSDDRRRLWLGIGRQLVQDEPGEQND